MTNAFKTLNSLNKCPHCSTSDPLLIHVWGGKTRGSTSGANCLWGAFVCNSCGGVVTAKSFLEYEAALLNNPDDVFPKPAVASDKIPETARRYLQQSFDTLGAPDAAAVMAGSAVDAMLKHLNLADGSLYHRIDQAVAQGLLTQGMADWAHAVRLGSNRPRHADAEHPHVSSEEARNSVEFAEALGNFLFVLKDKIDQGIRKSSEG